MIKISPEIFRLLLVAIVLSGCALIAWFLWPYFFICIRSWNGLIGEFIKEHYFLSLFLYIALYIVDSVLALPLASLMTVAAGFFYGPRVAIVATSIAATSGATLSFLLSRHIVGKHIQRAYAERLEGFNNLFRRYGTLFLLMVRLIPMIPFVMVNVLAGITIVPLKKFVWTTLVGLIPVTVILAYSGNEFQGVMVWSDLMNQKLIGLFLLLFFLLLIPLVLKKFRLMV